MRRDWVWAVSFVVACVVVAALLGYFVGTN
jgi:hypothetical protein